MESASVNDVSIKNELLHETFDVEEHSEIDPLAIGDNNVKNENVESERNEISFETVLIKNEYDEEMSNKDLSAEDDRQTEQLPNLEVTSGEGSSNADQESVVVVKKRARKTKELTKTCDECNKTFSNRAHFLRHFSAVHQKDKVLKCKFCSKDFNGKDQYKTHLKVVHKEVEIKKFTCSLCNKNFARNENLQVHIKLVHEKKRDFICKICGKDFGLKSNLNVHVDLVHNKKKEYVCNYCGRRFGLRSDLSKHETLVHRDNRLHSDLKCEKA